MLKINSLFGLVLILLLPEVVIGQACPACSNPALQSNEKLEISTDSLHKGTYSFNLNIINGSNYKGGHLNETGLDENGQIVSVPLHEHLVSLDFIRTEINLGYTFKANWTGFIRIPYDIKKQSASLNYIEPVTETEKQYILNNRDIHHRNENYIGLSDFQLLVSRRFSNVFGKNGWFDMSTGFSIPVGKIEENPLTAGENGLEHLHIQFGSGTVDPLIEFHYINKLTDKLMFAIYSMNRIPLYENVNGYKGPVETTSGIRLSHNISEWIRFRTTFTNYSQSQAKWDEQTDPNSGLVAFNGNIGLTIVSNFGLLISPSYRFPIFQKTFSGEGDTFEYGNTYLFNISYFLQ